MASMRCISVWNCPWTGRWGRGGDPRTLEFIDEGRSFLVLAVGVHARSDSSHEVMIVTPNLVVGWILIP